MSLCKDDYLFFYLDCDRISTLVLKQNVDVLSQVTGAHLEVFWPGWQTVEKCHRGQNSGWFHHIFYSRYMESAPTTLSEKLEYLFFSPWTFQCYFMNIHNKYFGKIFSALCVDVFTELFRIFPNFDIS
jgi:hypothetical protein